MRGVEQISGRELTSKVAADQALTAESLRQPAAWLILGAIVAATLLAYSPILFSFFVGDDFVHLTWLKDAVVNPELIWRNFHSSWLDGTTTKFYRPLISVFMVSDYLLWGLNGLGFHITNLLFHLTATVFLFLITRGLLPNQTERNAWLWPATAAAIFALYPLHPEAVSWITGRVDAIVTAFSLGSIWFYMQWRAAATPGLKALPWLMASLVCFILGLLSKEMAITVPAVLVVYELSKGLAIVRPLVKTLPFWAIIVAYFGVRYLSLGTFVGGYDDAPLFIADPKLFINNWLHALRMMVIPLNKELFGAHHIATKLWEVLLVGACTLVGISLFKNKQYRPAAFFVAAWLVLCLVPVYKIFSIADDLQGSRLAYLATAPLSVMLAFGLSTLGPLSLRAALCAALAGLCSYVLFNNNQPWREAGLQANAISAALEQVYAHVDGDPQTILLGLPDQLQGAYVARNALWGMTKRPQLSKDLVNCLMVNEFEPVQPFGFLKQSMVENRTAIAAFSWMPERLTFDVLPLPTLSELTAPTTLPIVAAGGVAATTNGKPDNRPLTFIECSAVPCWNIDFVRVDLDVNNAGQAPVGADLLYTNSLTPNFQLGRRTHADLADRSGPQSLLFSLRSLPQWSFGKAPALLKLLLPPGATATVRSVQAVPPAVLIPRLSFANSGYLGTKGYLGLDKQHPLRQLTIDASSIPGAVSSELEITRANLLFEEQNCKRLSKVSQPRIAARLHDTVQLHIKDFKAPGIYEARAWAKNKASQYIGLASDHIVLSVNP